MGNKYTEERKPSKTKTPTFLLELPLVADAGQAARVGGHLEVGRQFYNAMLSAGQHRLRRMRADPAWQEARAIPRTHKQERRVSWLAEHLDAVLAQTLASRAYHALNRVCVGMAKRVRFKSKSRGLDSIENKRNDTGMRFVLQTQDKGCRQGYLLWHDDQLRALIDWDDPVVSYSLSQRIKYARLVRRRASSPRAQGADSEGERYVVQLVLTGLPHHKPKHTAGTDTVGLDLGPTSIAIVPREAEARLEPLCAELRPDARAIRRLQRKMERQRRAANPEHYDERGRAKKRAKGAPRWKQSRGYQESLRRKATKERRLAAHRKSLHGQLVHQIVAVGHKIVTEKISYRGWQKRYGKSVGRCAPGMLIDHLRRTWASHGRHPARGPHSKYQTVAILSWLREVCQKAAVAALAPVPVRHRAGAARPVLGVSGCLPRSSRSHPLVCPVCRSLGGCGGAPAGSTRASHPTRERGAGRAPKHGYPPCRSASAPKSERTHTRASRSRSVEAGWKRGRNAQNPP
jgi:hypothetical protein